jgi:hypothetical protein
MRTSFRHAFVVCLGIAVTTAQITSAQQASPPPATAATNQPFALDDGTPIKLRLNRTLSSADAKTGDNIDFEVLEDVKIKDLVVIPKGSIALGTITDAEHKKRMARGGRLDIEIDYVKLADGEKAALRAVKETKGGGHTGAMTGAIVATSLVVWPAAPFFLFMHGKDTTIPKGTEITAYVNGSMVLDRAKFEPGPASTPAVASASSQTNPTNAQLDIVSNPAGAEISVDGNFMGDTPSDITVSSGVHTVTITKHGYKPWERKLTVSGGKINVTADLEQ